LNKGFFTADEIEVKKPQKRVSCFTCGLYRHCKTPKMPVAGKGKKGILIWAGVPGETADARNDPFAGKPSAFLNRELRKLGIDMEEDCWKVSAVRCMPYDKDGESRDAKEDEIAACRSMVWKDVAELKPKAIFLMGITALESFLGDRWPDALGGINKWRGWHIPDRKAGAWVMPMFHPAHILKAEHYQPVAVPIFKRDLKHAVKQAFAEFPVYKDERKLIKVLSEAEAIKELRYIYRIGMTQDRPITAAIDYETTGLKPYAKGHRIVCMSICVRQSDAFCFMMTDALVPYVQKILTCKGILKTAHNMKFEHMWSAEILGVEVKPWLHCSLIGAHVLDNREAITGLKFQAYANFGLEDYSSHIKPYLIGESNNANSFNRIDECDKNELMIYCGVDSLMQYRLALKQRKELGIIIEPEPAYGRILC